MPHTVLSENCPDLKHILTELQSLKTTIETDTSSEIAKLNVTETSRDNLLSIFNMWNYVTMRRQPIHHLQSSLASAGLSSLGRVEPHVMNNINSVIDVLSKAVNGGTPADAEEPFCIDYEGGYRQLQKRAKQLFGETPQGRSEYIMVTMPSEAATDLSLVENLFKSGMNCARVNCAHDDESVWLQMIGNIRSVAEREGKTCPVLMDLAGHKIRTGEMWVGKAKREKHKGDLKPPRLINGDSVILCKKLPQDISELNRLTLNKEVNVIVSCTCPDVVDMVEVGQMAWFDDGKIGAEIMEKTDGAVLLSVTKVGPKGARLKREKGINLPQTNMQLPTLSNKDIQDLAFVARHADMVGLSFTESDKDVVILQHKLAALGCDNLPILAKIETEKGVQNLPTILAQAMADNLAIGVMIARGDLAVELGSVRMAEIQDEILRLCESAHIPLVWATQVMESLAKKGTISRPEISDAAMSQRAECVMLNKGPYIAEAVAILSEVLERMEHHQYKSHTHLRVVSW